MPDQMMFYDALKIAAKKAGVPLSKIGPAIGRNGAYVSSAIGRGSDPSTGNASAMLGACGWALVAVPCDSMPRDALRIGAPVDAEDAERRALERRRDRLRRELEETEQLLG